MSNEEIVLNKNNYSSRNPINPGDVKRKRIVGGYVYERFYLIDFLGIKENSYVITSFGRILSILTGKELKPSSNKGNVYEKISLSMEGGGSKSFPIHRLVAITFVPLTTTDKRLNRCQVHHKNWDNLDNHYWNIEWRSVFETKMINDIYNGKIQTEEDIVIAVCKLLELKTPIVDIFEIIDEKMSKDKISKIKNRTIYTVASSDYRF